MAWQVVKLPVQAAFRRVSRLYLQLSQRKYRYIFILGHMRSGSTLLAHILASHPNIAGAGEMHVSYRTPADLQTLVLKTCEFLRRPVLSEEFVVDQINHDYVADDVLRSDLVHRCIILMRKPEATLKSMLSLKIWQENDALAAYLKRLEDLKHYGSVLDGRAILVEYDDLIERSGETLASLTSFLELGPPLTPGYTTHRMTARVSGYGDPSNNIKSGHIVRTPDHAISLSGDTLAAANRAFEDCWTYLRDATNRRAEALQS